jgi:hypothetical protein
MKMNGKNKNNMTKRIENFLKNLSIEELNEVRNTAANLIHHYEDGFQYECKVRSYGRSWTQKLKNSHAVQDLCYEYDGDNGIVGVYTNNPDLNIENYGETYYFPSMEEAERWRSHTYIANRIPEWKKELEKWEMRENIPFNSRPHFEPYLNAEEIAEREAQLEKDAPSIIQPVRLGYTYTQEEWK